jgi:hypothetical protein
MTDPYGCILDFLDRTKQRYIYNTIVYCYHIMSSNQQLVFIAIQNVMPWQVNSIRYYKMSVIIKSKFRQLNFT